MSGRRDTSSNIFLSSWTSFSATVLYLEVLCISVFVYLFIYNVCFCVLSCRVKQMAVNTTVAMRPIDFFLQGTIQA